MHIKKGDTVIVRTGKDRGKSGKVLRIDVKDNRILVEGINIFKKHSRPKKEGQKGETITISKPLPFSNIMLLCKTCGKGVRIGIRLEGEKKVRFCKQCETTF